MGQQEDLSNNLAVKKLREILDHNATCMFHTRRPTGEMDTRPMMIQQVDDVGSLWLLSGRSSSKNEELRNDPWVMLTITDDGHQEYLVLEGDVMISDDRAKKEEVFTSFAKAWFPEGVDDPELTLLKVKVTDGHYWDTKDGKLVSLMKIAGAAVSGTPNDSGSVQGAIRT